MICSECQDYTSSYSKIAKLYYCFDCINKFKLIKCPIYNCNNVISVNGYDDTIDIDRLTCGKCDTIVCDKCIINGKYINYCKECFEHDVD